jgi:uncharacterized protein
MMTVSRVWRRIPQMYNLVGKKCNECGELAFPPRDICRKCGHHSMSDYVFKDEGEIVTHTIIRVGMSDPEGEDMDILAAEIPYALAIIRLDEGPCLTAQVVDCSPDDVYIGMKVKSVFRKLSEKGSHGVIKYGYKFKPVR